MQPAHGHHTDPPDGCCFLTLNRQVSNYETHSTSTQWLEQNTPQASPLPSPLLSCINPRPFPFQEAGRAGGMDRRGPFSSPPTPRSSRARRRPPRSRAARAAAARAAGRTRRGSKGYESPSAAPWQHPTPPGLGLSPPRRGSIHEVPTTSPSSQPASAGRSGNAPALAFGGKGGTTVTRNGRPASRVPGSVTG